MIDEKQIERQISAQIDASAAAVLSVKSLSASLAKAAAAIGNCLLSGKKVLACGNGGSALDASHLVTELVVRFQDERPAYPAVSLCDSGSTLTAASNDYGFEQAFARQVRALGQKGDALVAFSTSGNSESVVNALKAGAELGLTTIAFLGKGGGACKGLAQIELIVPSDVTAYVQECHLVLYHTLCKLIDPALKTGKKSSA